MAYLSISPVITAEFLAELDLGGVNFVSNDRLVVRLAVTSASREQVTKALRINAWPHLWSLKIAFLTLGVIPLLAILLASRLPRCQPGVVAPERGPTS